MQSLVDFARTPAFWLIVGSLVICVLIPAFRRRFGNKAQKSTGSDEISDEVEGQAVYHSTDDKWSMAVKTNRPIPELEWNNVLDRLNDNVGLLKDNSERDTKKDT